MMMHGRGLAAMRACGRA